MSFEHSDFDHAARFDSRLLGSIGNAPHTNNGQAPIETPRRPQLSLVPAPIDVPPAIPAITPEDDLWQEKALCAQTDPEAFFPEKGGGARGGKRNCLGWGGEGRGPG